MDSVSIAFTGDIAFTKYFSLPLDPPFADENVQGFLRSADYAVGNVEGSFYRPETPNGKEFAHCSDPVAAPWIAEAGIGIWSLANNHALDFGAAGLKSTLQCAKACGCRTLGAGETPEEAYEPVVLKECGGIGILSATYAEKSMLKVPDCRFANARDREAMRAAIEKVKSACRWCVLVIHDGDEFSAMPMPETRNAYLAFLKMGADIIVAHHPHTVQPYETVGDKVIFYSLGNFIFDTDYQRSQLHTDVGELIKLRFREDGFSWEDMPVRIDRERRRTVEGDRPAIFFGMDAASYAALLPFAAKSLYDAKRRVSLYLKPDAFRNYNGMRWLIRDLRICRRNRAYGTIFRERLRSAFAGKKKGYEDIRAYLSAGKRQA